MKKALFILALTLCAPQLHAEQEELITPPLAETQDWQKFIDAASDNYSMKTRAGEAMRTLDIRIEEIIVGVGKDIDTKAKALLQSNQDAWEQQIRTKCSFLADAYRGGTYSGLAYGYCVVQEQVARAEELKQMHAYRTSP